MKRVLLVEDDDIDAELVEDAVRRYGSVLQLDRAASADMAWSRLRRQALRGRDRLPVCILLDLMMGGYDGLWLLRQMAAHPGLRDLPVLVLSQRGDAVVQARQYGNVIGAAEKPVYDADRRRLVGDLLRLAGGMGVSA